MTPYERLCDAMTRPLDEYHAADDVHVRRERLGWLVLVCLWVFVLLVAAGCQPPRGDGDVSTRPAVTEDGAR